MNQVISRHNKSILRTTSDPEQPQQRKCNCRKKSECPLNGNCQIKSVVYQATVTRTDNAHQETYVGLTPNTFKVRSYGHTGNFNNDNQRNRTATALSKYVWDLKDKNINYDINWSIVTRANSYSTSTKRCNLCITEKYFIIHKPLMSSLNNRNILL